MPHVFTIPPDVSFAEALAHRLWREADGDPLKLTQALVLLPTRRACRHVREAFLRVADGRAVLLPRLQPLGDADETELYFTDGALDPDLPPAIAPLRRQMLLTRLVAQKDKNLPFDQAAQLAEALAGLLDQVQIEKRDFSNLEQLVTGDLAKHWQDTVKFLEIVTAVWPKVLKDEGCLDPAERRNRVLAAQAASWRKQPPPFSVIAAGSTGSIPAVADLMAVIAALPLGRVVLPGLDQELDEEAWQAAEESHPQFNMKKWLALAGVERGDVRAWAESTSAALPPNVFPDALMADRRSSEAAETRRHKSDPESSDFLHEKEVAGLCLESKQHANIKADWVPDQLSFAEEAKRKLSGKTMGEGIYARAYRVRLLQEAMRPADTTHAWRELSRDLIPVEACAGLTRVELEHQQEEADVIALRLRAALEEKNKTAALVTPDRALAERVAAALRRWGIEANDSAGAPLTSLPVGSFLREVIQAASPDASAVDYLSLLKHPLAACGVDIAVCRQRAWRLEVDIWRGVRRASGWDGAVLAAKNAATGGGATTVTWVETIAAWFEHITRTWPMPLSFEERIRQHMALAEQVAATHEIGGAMRLWRGEEGEAAAGFFDDWLQATRDMPPVTGDDYVKLLGALLRGVVVRPAYGTHPRLHLLGPLEARLHHADVMILGGMNEGTWPPDPAIDPWLSRPMKRDFGLPLPERRAGLSAHDFVQLASAPEVLITRARRVDGSPTVPSRFLLQVEAVLSAVRGQGSGIREDILAPREPWREWARMLDAPGAIKPCDPPEPCPPVEARPATLSVTEIGTWLRNPYAIYARRILKLEPLDDIDADVTAAERGTIVHEVLEKFLKLHKDTWPADPMETLLALGRDVFAPFHDRPQVAAFWWPRFERIAAWFIAQEQTRRQEGMSVLAVEGDGAMPLAGGAFTLRGRVDRIDRLQDGTAAIIDYKTGVVPSQKDIELGYEPQLPLLALMLEEGGFKEPGSFEVSQLSYWPLKGGRGEDKAQSVKGDVAVHMEQARDQLERLIAEFAKPLTPYRAVPRPRFAPRYDDYAHLARQKEWGKGGGER